LKKRKWLLLLTFALVLLSGTIFAVIPRTPQNDGYEFVIGMSQANLNEPWRIAMNEEISQEALKYSNIKVVFRDAGGSTEKQASDIKELQNSGINLLIVSMDDSKNLTSVVSGVYQSIPVIVLDRAVEGYDYTMYIGNDNLSIGRQVGSLVSDLVGKKNGNIIEIQGALDSATTVERSEGFREVLKGHPNVNLERTLICNWKLDDASSDVSQVLREPNSKIDLIFADSDFMALGAYQAAHAIGLKPIIIGIDGLKGKNGGLNLVKSGVLQGTFTCSTGGIEAVDYAVKILNGEGDIPKKVILRSNLVTSKNVDQYLNNNTTVSKRDRIVLGYAQLASESKWRDASAKSIKEAAKKEGIDLVFLESGQTQDDQKALIRQLIRKKVDIISFSPIVQSGWDDVLTEAKKANIPVIISDRNVDSDESLWQCNIGSDFTEEARRVGRQIVQYCEDNAAGRTVNVLQIMGTQGSSAELGRNDGLREILDTDKYITCTNSAFCDFTYSSGKLEMERYLKQYGSRFTVVYAQNDDMALGAIDAIKEYGLKPGKAIIVFGTDGTKQALLAVKRGEMYNTVECNPLLGPQLMLATRKVAEGEMVPLRIINSENLFNRDINYWTIFNREY
jgi:galactofuranose transport system substrate-binding protein